MQDNNFPARKENIIRFEKKAPPPKPPQSHPPLIDMPEATKILTFSIALIFVILWGLGQLIPDFPTDRIFGELGFVSARWTGGLPFDIATPLSLVTINFLHGGWFHMIMNAVTIVAFGAGIEKRMGAQKMLILFFASSLFAILSHLAISPNSMEPVIGASGGISGLFGAVLVMLKHDGRLQGNTQRILPMALMWIAITVVFGVMGAPDGSSVAWIAHIGGFLGGLGIAAVMMRKL